jgi:ribonuclease J
MKIIICRGAKEIGGSCVELAANSSRILIDFGSPLRDKNGEDMSLDKYSSLKQRRAYPGRPSA